VRRKTHWKMFLRELEEMGEGKQFTIHDLNLYSRYFRGWLAHALKVLTRRGVVRRIEKKQKWVDLCHRVSCSTYEVVSVEKLREFRREWLGS